MTPPDPDLDAAEAKLILISDLLHDLDRLGDVGAADLRADRNLRHVVERVLTQLVDLAAGLNTVLARLRSHRRPSGYRDSFKLLVESGVLHSDLAARLESSVGMRNILTHEYGNVDLTKVAEAVPVARTDYGEYLEQIRAFLLDQRPG